MTYKDFAMWLQGILEMSPEGLTDKQVAYILSKIGTLTFPASLPTAGSGVRC